MSAWTTTSAARNCIRNMTTSHDKQNGNCGVHFVLHFSFSNHWESNVARRVLRSWRTDVRLCLLLFLFYCCARRTATVFLLSKIQIRTTFGIESLVDLQYLFFAACSLSCLAWKVHEWREELRLRDSGGFNEQEERRSQQQLVCEKAKTEL